MLVGKPIDAETARQVGEAAAEGLPSPPSDVHASAAYRQHLISVLTERVLVEAQERGSAIEPGEHAN
jgi:CO/xanthine dehydrogenase FAD-binding subunit